MTAASNLISVSLNATRDADKVGLNVTWIPGRFTGPTNYTVKLEEKISLSSDSYTAKDTKEVVGYDKNFFNFPELLGYWDYKVTVTANTSEGQSSPKVESKKTFMKPPGLATFNITVDPIVATKVTISINCPEEKERNGIIVKYTVKKILLRADGNDPDMILFQSIDRTQESENPCEVTKQLLTDVRVERNYSVEVATINKEFSGVFSGGYNFYVPVKLPFPLATDTVKMLSTSETKLEVTICRDCVASETQGRIQILLLAVCSVYSNCFHSGKRKRSIEAIINSTWSEAKKSGFTIGYRTTPLDWLNQLRVSQDRFVNYIIGRDTTCEIGDTGYCNGPLPSSTKFKILVLECNSAGCVSLSSETVATKDEEANYTALAVGLSLGLLCIIIISIVAVVCIKRHHRNKKSEAMRRQAPLYNTLNRTFQDDHLYGIANDKMTPVIREPEHVNQPASNEDVYQEIPDSKNYQVTSVDDYQNSISAVKSK
ncbi:uncharacterized protein LOC131957763 [Physella acuta]|uniref:uncharacterized protein LOC131957763 n=1 Tax=Physella acuta TaxID=109671 RepID=UPI0027DBDBB9|nr:uncharacterized protein LOC131957763 [Physella acuta]